MNLQCDGIDLGFLLGADVGTGVVAGAVGGGSSSRRRSPSVTGSSLSRGGVGTLLEDSPLEGMVLTDLLEDFGVFASRRSSLCSLVVFKVGLTGEAGMRVRLACQMKLG